MLLGATATNQDSGKYTSAISLPAAIVADVTGVIWGLLGFVRLSVPETCLRRTSKCRAIRSLRGAGIAMVEILAIDSFPDALAIFVCRRDAPQVLSGA